jgi:hypothetical protein
LAPAAPTNTATTVVVLRPPPHTQEQHDLLCVLLMIRLNAEHRALMVARRVPCLDDYLDRVNLLLWPRFKVGSSRGRDSAWALVASRPDRSVE